MTSLPRRGATLRGLVLVLLLTLAGGLALAAPARSAPLPRADRDDVSRGTWTVSPLAGRRWSVSWRSPSALPIRSDRPTVVDRTGRPVGVSTMGTDGRTVTAVVTGARRPSVADLDVLLSGDRLDVVGNDARTAGLSRAGAGRTAREVSALAVDPGVPGDFAVQTSEYALPAVAVDGLAAPVEMVGHVVEPTAASATGPRPLVLFLHGRHEFCYGGDDEQNDTWPCRAPAQEIPSHLGYDYAQRLLASQGYATVSIRVNGINAQDGGLDDAGAAARAVLVQKHLDYWTTLAAGHQVDLDKVVLVGHSRGGEGVNRASIVIPLSAPYRIVGQILVAPTDFGAQTAPYVPTVTLLPYCDGDVFDLQGQQFTDVSRDLTRGDTSLKSSVLVMGANHNFFNTEWTPGQSVAPSSDDWFGPEEGLCGTEHPGRLSATEQQSFAQTYIAGATRLFAEDEQGFLPLFDGSATSVASAAPAVVQSHALGGDRDVRRPRLDTDLSLADGADTSFCDGRVTYEELDPAACGSQTGEYVSPHWLVSDQNPAPTRDFFQMSWSAEDQSGGLLLGDPLDLSDRVLDLRTIVDPRVGPAAFRIRLGDADGGSAVVTPQGGPGLPSLPIGEYATKLWAQNVRVDTAGVTGVDLGAVTRIDLVSASDEGRLWIADVAAADDDLAVVPTRRAPILSIGDLTVDEGDGGGWTLAQLPYTLTGTVDRPARFSVLTVGEREGSVRRLVVDVAPGQTRGTIPVAFPTNEVDDFTSYAVVAAWATRNATTGDYVGRLTVRDDDPRPTVTVTRVKKTVKEGQSAQWRVRLSQPTGYPIAVSAKVAKGPSHRLNGYDVSKAWLDRHATGTKRSRSLYRLNTRLDDSIDLGDRTVTLSIPISKDGKREGRESVALRVHLFGKSYTETVYVAKSR